MEKNVGGYDRISRWVIGGALGIYGLKTSGWKRWLALSAAGSLLGTAGAEKCLMNRALGINTRPSDKKSLVDETSEESFPASDAPAWAGSR